MGRALHRLSAVAVNKLEPGMHNDGHGLYLRVSDTGTRSWIFRFTLGGKTRDMGLGGTAVVSLASARKRAQELRELRQRGIDPITHQQASVAAARVVQAKSVSFREAAERYIASHEATWTRKHHADWVGTMRDYVFPVLGVLPVSVIDTALVMQVLEPLWRSKTETGSRVRGRIEAILDWARVAGLRDGPEPGGLEGAPCPHAAASVSGTADRALQGPRLPGSAGVHVQAAGRQQHECTSLGVRDSDRGPLGRGERRDVG